jgi:hypothetical protein
MVASVVIYAVAVELLRTRLGPGGAAPGVPADLLRYAFYLLAGVEGLAIPFVRRAVEALPGDRASVPARLRTGAVAVAALAEVPAVMGLVLFVLAGRRWDFYLLAGWSLLLQLRHFPRRERWAEAAGAAARRPP